MSSRVTYRREESGRNRQLGKGFSASRGSESVAAATDYGRVSAAQLAVVRDRLGEVDWAMLSVFRAYRVATSGQLQRLYVVSATPLANVRRTNRRLELLVELRVLARLPRRVGGIHGGSTEAVFALDVVGSRLLFPDRPARAPWTSGSLHVRHGLLILECWLQLVEAARAGTITRPQIWPEPESWIDFQGRGALVTLKPDAEVHFQAGSDEVWSYVEVDCATESMPAVRRKALVYGQLVRSGRIQEPDGLLPSVIWLVPDQHRVRQLGQVIAGLPEEERGLHLVAGHNQLVAGLLRPQSH